MQGKKLGVRAVRGGGSAGGSRLCGCLTPYRLLVLALAAGVLLWATVVASIIVAPGSSADAAAGASAPASAAAAGGGGGGGVAAGAYVRASPAPVVKASPRALPARTTLDARARAHERPSLHSLPRRAAAAPPPPPPPP